ncbi:pilus assembly protein CpaF [Natranaerovirga pectinivora]|uniref:Pilus assembly protein CpaF n=1 Tax=Natranaerovirga pectinivora TaxID=682400 RepID=A0A4R3MS35_9FIRM|nr:ATPase, T2SS/T4P/T4SS family [Natranaerovirga pectinivora]TCT17028.1 pilus assembly protein CpaF [Natranaerovirga pectinivora]
MPLIKTQNEYLYKTQNLIKDKNKHYTLDSHKFIKEIINQVIKEYYTLIYDVNNGVNSEPLKKEVERLIDKNFKQVLFDREEVKKQVFNFLFGYGILQDLINDDTISDIDFTRYNYGTIKRNGKKELLDIQFEDEKEFENFSKLMILRNGGIIDENNSHCRVSDERYRLRINVAIQPRNNTGTCLIIRKHRMNQYNLDDLQSLKMITAEQKNYLKENAKNLNKSFFIIGKGAAGKTTLLRAILMEIDKLKSVMICEKDTELYLNDHPNFILQKIKKEEEGGKKVTLRDLVRDSLTMSIDALFIGEMVADEVWDVINAGSTDHIVGGTLHSKSKEEFIERIITMIDLGRLNLSEITIKKIIKNAIPFFVYIKDFRVVNITEIVDYNPKKDEFVFKEILRSDID